MSTTEVQHRDPLGPLPFALVLHHLLHQIRDRYKLHLHAWYLDDETSVRDLDEVAKALTIIQGFRSTLGLELHIRKTEGLFPSDIGRSSLR